MASSARGSLDDATDADVESQQRPQRPPVQHSLSHAVHARRAEYTRPHQIKVKVGTWNVAACSGVEKDIGAWFVDGKGVDSNLSTLSISEDNAAKVESIESQEARRSNKHSTIPSNDVAVVAGGDDIGLYVLGLQEVVELASAKEYMSRIYTDPGPLTKWKKSMTEALPAGYDLVSEQQLSGLVLLIYASPEVSPSISSISMQSVGTGIMGYLGNKGGLSTRIVLGETTRLVFVNSHLASGTDPTHLDRRCWDVAQILSRTKFDPISRGGVLDDHAESIGDEDFAFWFGDLNFRLEGLPGPDIRRLLMLHTRGEYGIGSKSKKKLDDELAQNNAPIIISKVDDSDDDSSPSTIQTKRSSAYSNSTDDTSLPDPDDFVQDPHADPLSLQATLDSLLPHDQLGRVRRDKKAFHDGWREGPITFLPTYRYDVGSVGMFDSSEKKRTPSWCDRILFRTRRDKLEFEGKSQEAELARLKDEEMTARGIDHASEDEDILFDYDPESDGADNEDFKDYDEYEEDEAHPPEIATKEGFVDKIHLELYTSHQRVLSSDHKPVNAVFTLQYDAVVPELKLRIQHEVARDLDRAENEGRPMITVVLDHSQDADNLNTPSKSSKPAETEGSEGVNFGEVRYLKKIRRGLTVANTGQVSARFSFVNRPAAPGAKESIAPDWVRFGVIGSDYEDPQQSSLRLDEDITLEPGDTINVGLEAFVEDMALVRSFNSGAQKLDDVLVLRVTDGRDHFIPVRGSWLQSCFGGTIDELIRVPEGGVRALMPRKKGEAGTGLVNRGEEVRWSAPRELFKLTEAVEALMDRTIADADMIDDLQIAQAAIGWPFASNTWMVESNDIRTIRRSYLLEALDCDKSVIDAFPPEIPAYEKLEIVAEVLVMFLSSLADGVITSALCERLEEEMRRPNKEPMTAGEEKAWVLDVVATAPNHNISLVFLTTMLGKIAADLAPVATSNSRNPSNGGFSITRSLSFKGRTPPPEDPQILKRQAINKKFSEIFGPAIFRGFPNVVKERERRAVQERQRHIIEAFLEEFMEQQIS